MSKLNQRIVLVVKDAVMSEKIALLMSRKNLEVVTCEEPEAARALLSQKPIDILILDLPLGLNLARHVSANYPETILVGLDLDSNIHTIEQAQKIGISIILESVELESLGKANAQGSIKHFERLEDFLEKAQVKAFLQPIFDLKDTKNILGLESLARPPKHLSLWNPETLFNYAARKEHLLETDLLCLEAAFKEAKKVPKLDKLFVNLRPRSLTHKLFLEKLINLTQKTKIKPSQLIFELTEQQSILNFKGFIEKLDELRKIGFRFALDDFGTGFANLEWLYELRPNYLKIAGVFCRNLEKDKTKQILIKATTQIASELNIPTVLENIETQAELEMARELGVNYGQGYFFMKPLPANQLLEGLAEKQRL